MDAQPAPELSLLELIRADIEATTHQNYRLISPAKFWGRALAKLLTSPSVRVVIMYRIAHELTRRGHLSAGFLLRARGIRVSGAEINPYAVIGPGLYLAHSVGVGIGSHVTIGRNCRMYLGAVVGPHATGTDEVRFTTIGDDVTIGTHAVVLAGVKIGDGAVIGANAVVMRDVEPYTVVSASPAKVVGEVTDRD